MPVAIEIAGLTKSFGANVVLRGVDLSVEAGEVLAIIGRSGSGKSTLLRCVNGLERFDAGRLEVEGAPVVSSDGAALRALRRRVGMIFQNFNLFPHLDAGRNVMLAPRLVRRLAPAQARADAERLLARVGLADKFDAMPRDLSGGQRQRVAIARALAMSPSIMLCDEITSALDPELVGEVLDVVEGLAADGMTLLMVTHEMAFARKVADRVVFMHQGRVHEQGPPDRLFSAPETPELQRFLSSLRD